MKKDKNLSRNEFIINIFSFSKNQNYLSHPTKIFQ